MVFIFYMDEILLTGWKASLVKKLDIGLMSRYFMADLCEDGLLLSITAVRAYVRVILELDGMLKCSVVQNTRSWPEIRTKQVEIKLLDAARVVLDQQIVG